MFSSKKRTDYQWDPSIPLPSVNSNSSNSESRGKMKELKVVIDYMIPRVVAVSKCRKPVDLPMELDFIIVLDL